MMIGPSSAFCVNQPIFRYSGHSFLHSMDECGILDFQRASIGALYAV